MRQIFSRKKPNIHLAFLIFPPRFLEILSSLFRNLLLAFLKIWNIHDFYIFLHPKNDSNSL